MQLFSNTLPNSPNLTWSITSRDGIRMKGAQGGMLLILLDLSLCSAYVVTPRPPSSTSTPETDSPSMDTTATDTEPGIIVNLNV